MYHLVCADDEITFVVSGQELPFTFEFYDEAEAFLARHGLQDQYWVEKFFGKGRTWVYESQQREDEDYDEEAAIIPYQNRRSG